LTVIHDELLHAIEKAFADHSLLHDENENLLKQNEEKELCQNAKSTVISQGDAKTISSADIAEMQRRQASKADAKKAKADAKRAEAGAKKAEACAKKARVPTKRKWKVESMGSTHEHDNQAHQMAVGPSALCPGRAPVAQMW
jgi:uncharacterized protein YqfA (UPF0365 family)